MHLRPVHFASIPEGTFLMGENDNDRFANETERPRHVVHIPAFELARNPVSVAEYRQFDPSHETGTSDDTPVTSVSWNDAIAYCTWLGPNYRLSSEAEWEYAARAGSQNLYPWGNTIDTTQANFYYDENGTRVGLGRMTPPGAFPPNAFGLNDMIGNVCEWTADRWHPNYLGAPDDGSPWVTGETRSRVIRGGAWDYLPRLLRVSWRDHLDESSKRDNVGFRVAR
jgi:formylglycine-generating enzyme required for sulfatase activity